jgi:2-oxoglutarate dehydrogenase E1 component
MSDGTLTSTDFISRANSDYIETLYEKYLEDPRSLDQSWHAFFAGFDLADGHSQTVLMREQDVDVESATPTSKGVFALVNAYRHFGHFIAKIDPLGHNRDTHPFLTLSQFGLSNNDLDMHVGNGGFEGPTDGTLRDLLDKLRTTYCGNMGVEYRNLSDVNQRSWLQGSIEPFLNKPNLSVEEKRIILKSLITADELEQYLHLNYMGQKRFSIEGGDSFIPLMDTLVETGADFGVDDLIVGMAHRGRINTLAHILHKPYEMILSEFEHTNSDEHEEGDGDVKYHNGYSYDHVTSKGKNIHLSLSYNPSHLELVNPAIEGIVWSKQNLRKDVNKTKNVPVLVHGDAAFTGQGIVTEVLAFSGLEGYNTGGTIHIIVDNQLGFTAIPSQTRCTIYPTDAAKMIQAPVFHVNGDDPEQVVHAAKLAMIYRCRFKTDVMIHLMCYRRYGHNESDDAMFTQPLMYKQIEKHERVCDLYSKRLIEHGVIKEHEPEEMRLEVRARLDKAREAAPEIKAGDRVNVFGGRWMGLKQAADDWYADTAIPMDVIKKIGERATRVPANFNAYKKIKRLMEGRAKMIAGETPLDWGCGEMLAYGSLLLEGIPVRLSGQDCERGTFSHRHSVWYDVETGESYTPLQHLGNDQAEFTVINSLLSELAVLGFEYGVAITDPNRLVIWEAQFGDFVNGAQAVVDEFIVSAEAKWKRMNGIVMQLPHGYEGQGPDHSSARLERFLSLCADNNIQVCYPTTPAQYFHMIRTQIHRKFRKPLIVMTPKSLLRHKLAVSDVKEFNKGSFQAVLDDFEAKPTEVTRVLLCTGKVYYDLYEKRQSLEINDTAIIRLEQLYPFPKKEMKELIKKYVNCSEYYWVQEEPENMGAYMFIERKLRPLMKRLPPLRYVGRPEASSPATGSHHQHQFEQELLVNKAFADTYVYTSDEEEEE